MEYAVDLDRPALLQLGKSSQFSFIYACPTEHRRDHHDHSASPRMKKDIFSSSSSSSYRSLVVGSRGGISMTAPRRALRYFLVGEGRHRDCLLVGCYARAPSSSKGKGKSSAPRRSLCSPLAGPHGKDNATDPRRSLRSLISGG